MQFEGPRPACRALDSLTDDIGNSIIEAIKASPPLAHYTDDQENLIKAVEKILVDVFAGEKVQSIRDYIYRGKRIED